MNFSIAPGIFEKLKTRHKVTEAEIEECFLNRQYNHLIDDREEHDTDPPTQWFISETDTGRLLKIVWMKDEVLGIVIKSAYEPGRDTIDYYMRKQ